MQILYFAWVREKIGKDEETIALPAGINNVTALLDWLKGLSAGHAEAFADTARLRIAIDQKFAPLDAPLGNAREIAIFPPVTGGQSDD